MKKIVPLWDEYYVGMGRGLRIPSPGLESLLAHDPFYKNKIFRIGIIRSLIERHNINQNKITQLQDNITLTSEGNSNPSRQLSLTSIQFGYKLFCHNRCNNINFFYKEIIGIWIISGLKTNLMDEGIGFLGNAADAIFEKIGVSDVELKHFLRKETLPLPSAIFAEEADSTDKVARELADIFSNNGYWKTIVDWKEIASMTAKIIGNLRAGIPENSRAIFSDPGLTWLNIKITLIEKNTLEFTNLLTNERKLKSHINLGLTDKRTGKASEPNKLWGLLCTLAMYRGQVARGDKSFKDKFPNSKQFISNLRKLFHEWFPTIEGDPFKSSRQTGGYRLIFTIEDKNHGSA